MRTVEILKAVVKRSPAYPLVKGGRGAYRQLQRRIAREREIRRLVREPQYRNSNFYTLEPSLLVAIVKAFNIQRRACKDGRNLLDGHGYYEFGVFKGFSFWLAEQVSREYVGPNFRLYGFDSFEGLPRSHVDADLTGWREGRYAASFEIVTDDLKRHGMDSTRASLYKGFYSKQFFSMLTQRERFLPVSICVIDSDIYESAVLVLDFVNDLLVPGSLLLFDDFGPQAKNENHGERRAFREFEEIHPSFQKENLFDYGSNGVAFRVLGM